MITSTTNYDGRQHEGWQRNRCIIADVTLQIAQELYNDGV
jgi:hypothetical protein